MPSYKKITKELEKGNRNSALDLFSLYLDKIGGPTAETVEEEDRIRLINLGFTIWEQIDVYNEEVAKRPDSPRSWKLLGYAYMCAGLYVPVLLYLAEHCLQASIVRYEDESLLTNIEEKINIIERARNGDEEARREILEAEAGLALAFDRFPEKVPVPNVFFQNSIVAESEIKINENNVATDVLGEDKGITDIDENDIDTYRN